MKKIIVTAILVGVLIINVFANDAKTNAICTDLLSKRATAWAMVIDTTKTVEDFREVVTEFEMGIQLSDDILFFGQMKEDGTDMETVTIVSFKTNKVEYSGDIMTIHGEQIAIVDTMEGIQEEVKLQQKIAIKKINKSWYIKSIEVLTPQ